MNARDVLAALGRERGGEVADQQVARGLAAHVQLVAHLEALRGEREHVDRARRARAARASTGPSVVAEEAQALDGLVVADAEPERPPGPLVERRERPHAVASSSTTQTAIDGEQTPVIGPDVAVLVAGSQRDLAGAPAGARRPSRSPAQPSNRHAASSARRCGSHTLVPRDRRARSAGARRRARPATTSPARRDGQRPRPDASMRSTASALAARRARRGGPTAPRASASVAASPPAGGRQSTSTTSAPWSRSASAKPSRPTFTAATRWKTPGHRLNPPVVSSVGRRCRPAVLADARPHRPRAARQARPRPDRPPARARGDRRRRRRARSRTATASCWCAARRSSPRVRRRPTRSPPAPRRSSTNVVRHPRDGRPAARARRHARRAPTARTREQRARRASRGRPTLLGVPSSAGT